MSFITHPAEIRFRSVLEWLVLADKGALALPTFQRSYVWDNKRIASYLNALFRNRPTGIFLVLEVGESLTFDSRTLKGIEADREMATELLLDGQQRLTSLWSALKGKLTHRFFAHVADLEGQNMAVQQVEYYLPQSKKGKEIKVPRKAYNENLIPVDILIDDIDLESTISDLPHDHPGKIWQWAKNTCIGDDDAKRNLESTIKNSLRKILQRKLHYCFLPVQTDPREAIDIYVETNRSSATIKMFDIVVGIAQQEYREDLRNRIAIFQRANPTMSYYFDRDAERMIPQVGEVLLKVACLKFREGGSHKALLPTQRNYEKALSSFFTDGRDRGLERLDKLQDDLKGALQFVAQHGGTTKSTLPTWPPVYVIAALQDSLRGINKPLWQGTARRLISAFLWRSFLTDRYQAQANDRLFHDFRGLRTCLMKIASSGTYAKTDLPPIFKNLEHPVPKASVLRNPKHSTWIKSGRLGRAIVAVAMQNAPQDWVTEAVLDVSTVRELEDHRKLDRHHVFPTRYLRDHVGKDQINLGLNGVLLSTGGNKALSSKAPDEYLKKILDEDPHLSEDKLRQKVESHLVPYDTLKAVGTPKDRYRKFVEARAQLMADRISSLTKP